MTTNGIAILISLFCLGCSAQTYQLHINESFSPPDQQMRMSDGSLIANARQDSLLEVTGVYCGANVFIDQYPVIRIYNDRKYYVPLSAKLQCPDGMLVKVKGKVVQLSVTYSLIKKTLSYNHLEPMDFEVVFNTKKIIKDVTEEYHRIRQKLQEQITIEQSKLQLSADPLWAIWYDEVEKKYLFHSHQFDLMYAADIEFVVDARKGRIKDVYAKEWFKGE